MHTCRFKIDYRSYHFNGEHGEFYALYRRTGIVGLFKKETLWENVGTFPSREAARAKYEEIKDLPEYLA